MGLLQTIQGRLLQYDSPSRQLQQAHFDAARRLAQAQFQLADAELSQRLWQDVADRDGVRLWLARAAAHQRDCDGAHQGCGRPGPALWKRHLPL